MKADRSESKGNKKIKGVHTIFSFELPYAIPVPDGVYKIKVGRYTAKIDLKRVQKTWIEGMQLGYKGIHGKRYAQIPFDKYGKSSYSLIKIEFPWRIDLSEKGRKPKLLGDVPLRSKAKENALRFLNRFIETVRYVTGKYWVEPARYQDILSSEVIYWDEKKKRRAGRIFDSGVGEMVFGEGDPFQIEAKKMQKLRNLLENELHLDPSRIFLLNSKDACLQEDYRLAIVEAVTALETVLYKFIRRQGEKLGIAKKDLEHFIVDVGLTGNISIVLKMLTKGLEQIDAEIVRKCKGAIKIRNKILHEGFMKVSSTDTEEKLVAVEKMIAYLNRFIAIDDFQRMRRERMDLFLKELERRREADWRTFLARMEVKYGVKFKTGKECLVDLEAIGKVRFDEDMIIYIEDKKKNNQNLD